MATGMRRGWLVWPPRVLAGLVTFMLGLLATDAFSEGGDFVTQFGGFLIHLAPCFLLIGLSFLAWIRPRGGGLGFIFLGLLATVWFVREKEMGAFLFLGLPLLAAGLLFLISSGRRFQRR